MSNLRILQSQRLPEPDVCFRTLSPCTCRGTVNLVLPEVVRWNGAICPNCFLSESEFNIEIFDFDLEFEATSFTLPQCFTIEGDPTISTCGTGFSPQRGSGEYELQLTDGHNGNGGFDSGRVSITFTSSTVSSSFIFFEDVVTVTDCSFADRHATTLQGQRQKEIVLPLSSFCKSGMCLHLYSTEPVEAVIEVPTVGFAELRFVGARTEKVHIPRSVIEQATKTSEDAIIKIKPNGPIHAFYLCEP